MSSSTVHWSPGEASLSRASLNTLLQPGDKLDVTEAMMKAATIGRAAEIGNGWEPPGMISRKIASILSSRSPGSQGPAASLGAFAALLEGSSGAAPQPPAPQVKVMKSASLPTLQRSSPPFKTNWATMVPRRQPADGK
ncbi:unnamed protein product [Effrenium voratum]|nr:unnamed protein product [Effrenium voratum]CAJ1462049.1 unnamed protein product [Effrenium voratum]|eukprot:CAMPEP_0181462236 /NCGR_PEP_ID=MMETSP1110-20121109/34292_1 /TAXON_ID=174948 /ORGANISM="Symbiodinium sp., Strain CCMP421" /LENGTH=137 /DNA_ID=CAMNT_0023586891 /DNA_START=58 /DNA_END=471 /DNA_ORIENTATION=+